MTYPLSADVSAGQPTAAAHYNNLRTDALHLGQPASGSVPLGELLVRYASGITLEYLATNRLRIPATPAEPVCIVIGGVPLAASANVDLPVGSAPSGAAAEYYAFAVSSPSSQTFTLDVNTSPGESATRRLVGRFYWNGSAIDQNSIRSEAGGYTRTILGEAVPLLCQGRLTLSSGVPVPASDLTGGVVYFTPFHGAAVALYSPNRAWRLRAFSEVSLSLSGIASGKNVDIFLYDNAGSLSLEADTWTSDSSRATALALQDGVYVKSGSPGRRYLGTLRTSASGEASDGEQKRFVWNACNRVPRVMRVVDVTNSWTYASAAWRALNNSTANRLEVVIGLDEDPLDVQLAYEFTNSGLNTSVFGIGLDSTTANSAQVNPGHALTGVGFGCARYLGRPGAGYHYLQMLEYAASGVTITVYGDLGVAYYQGGALGCVWA